jgi:hypothetical protein
MKPRKAKNTNEHEPSVRDRLASDFLKAFEADFRAHGIGVIELLRERAPERYAEVAVKLIAAAEQPGSTSPYAKAKSTRDFARILLMEQGLAEWQVSDHLVDQAVAALERHAAEVELIATQGGGDFQ